MTWKFLITALRTIESVTETVGCVEIGRRKAEGPEGRKVGRAGRQTSGIGANRESLAFLSFLPSAAFLSFLAFLPFLLRLDLAQLAGGHDE